MKAIDPQLTSAQGATQALHGNTAIEVSFEFFPPADSEMEATLWKSVERLAPLAPRFVSVTYGADGSTRECGGSPGTRPSSASRRFPPTPSPRRNPCRDRVANYFSRYGRRRG